MPQSSTRTTSTTSGEGNGQPRPVRARRRVHHVPDDHGDVRPDDAGPDPEAVVSALAESDILKALQRGRWDIAYFSEAVLGITPHAGQKSLFDAIIRRDFSGYEAKYLTVCVSAGNRAGKTLGLAIVVAHSTLYKLGFPLPASADDDLLKAWTTAPYDWYHFGISQEVTELLHLELQRILMGVHEAQKGGGCPLTEALGLDVADWSKKERGEWAWFKWAELLGGGEVHFRTTGEKALSTLGRDMHGWSYDEPAFDANLTFVFDEVLNLRRLSTGGQAVLISTATEGSHEYEDIWRRGDPTAPDREPDYCSLRMSTRDNVGYGIAPSMFDRMLRTVPPSLVPQNIDGYFLEARSAYFATDSVKRAFFRGLPPHEGFIQGEGKRYAHGVDPALTYDSTWSIVLDVSDPERWVGVSARHREGRQTADSIVALTADVHHEYAQEGRCTSGVDVTGFGGKVFRSLLQQARVPIVSVEFGGKAATKQRLLANVRTALDSGRLVFPESEAWLTLRRQLLGYKLADRKLQTDAVMALAVCIKMAVRNLYGEGKPLPFDYFGTPFVGPRQGALASVPEEPRPYVDDRMLRLGSLTTANVAPMSGLFKR